MLSVDPSEAYEPMKCEVNYLQLIPGTTSPPSIWDYWRKVEGTAVEAQDGSGSIQKPVEDKATFLDSFALEDLIAALKRRGMEATSYPVYPLPLYPYYPPQYPSYQPGVIYC